MKKYLFVAAVLLCGTSVFTSCSKDDEPEPEPQVQTKTLDFEGAYFSALIDNPQYGGKKLYGDQTGTTPVTYTWTDANNTFLTSNLTAAYGGYYGYSEGGIAISNYIDGDIINHATFNYQLSVPSSNGSNNFAVSYDKSIMIFSDRQPRVIQSMMVSPTTYELGVITYGDETAASLAKGGNLTITIEGMNNAVSTGKVTVDMASNGTFLTKWTKVDLKKLGKVTSLIFTMDGSDKNDYGCKSPKYFAFDDVVVEM